MFDFKKGTLLYCMLSLLFPFLGQADFSSRPLAAHIIIPQSRVLSANNTQTAQITAINVGVVILQQVATTTMDINLKNPTNRQLEAEMVIPVPNGAVIRGFTFQGAASEPTAQILPHDVARKTYDAIVAKLRDPALLEFIGYNLVRSSVFPVPAHGTQKIRFTYEHILSADNNRVDYVLPRTESINYRIPWKINMRIKATTPISTVYSPSHELETTRVNSNIISTRITPAASLEPGTFQLSYLLEKDGVTASLFTYPDPAIGGGYFLLLAGLPTKSREKENTIKREVTLVLDRSGSMNGEKLEQVREAALQIIAGLEENEAFNIIIYNEYVDLFSPLPVLKTKENVKAARHFLKGILARGGTNIHDALTEALRQKPIPGKLPLVLFLTDGLATIGKTSEVAISKISSQINKYQRRVFTFGVGVDVNTPLLERIATETRATSTFVFPKENVEVKVAQVFKRLSGPILASPSLKFFKKDGSPAIGRILDVLPNQIPDLFDGDQLLLLGQYIGEEPVTFHVSGNYLGKKRTFQFAFNFNKATTRNAFVPRLWASRKIARLVEEIRRQGATTNGFGTQTKIDPKLKELINEVIRLSTEFGILTEYTAFLAREGTNLTQKDLIMQEAGKNFIDRALHCRSGWGSVNQEVNNKFGKSQSYYNRGNGYFDETMKKVSIMNVQQVNDRTFYQRKGCWVDSKAVEKETKPDQTIKFGSKEFYELARKLAKQGRQGCISLKGDILIIVDGKLIFIDA